MYPFWSCFIATVTDYAILSFMVIEVCEISLHLPDCHTLKEKRPDTVMSKFESELISW